MKPRRQYLPRAIALSTIVVLSVSVANASVIVLFNPTPDSGNGIDSWGQSLTTPAGPAYNNLTFNAFDFIGSGAPSTRSHATGEVFLLTQEYLGSPAALSSSTPGYVSHTSATQVEGTGLEWVFPAGASVSPNTTYYFYARNATGTRATSGGVDYAGGIYYQSSSFGGTANYFSDANVDWNFELEGTAIIPEPASGLLALLAGFFAATTRRRRA